MNSKTVRVYSGKTFKFDFSSTSLTEKGSLKAHIGTIHEEKRFKCDNCSSSFIQKGYLKNNIKSDHERKLSNMIFVHQFYSKRQLEKTY